MRRSCRLSFHVSVFRLRYVFLVLGCEGKKFCRARVGVGVDFCVVCRQGRYGTSNYILCTIGASFILSSEWDE